MKGAPRTYSTSDSSRVGRCVNIMRYFPSRVGVIAIIPFMLAPGITAAPNNVKTEQSPGTSGAGHFAAGTFSPGAVARAGVGAAVHQANHTPQEWGQGAAGFGRRFASAFGKHIVSHSIHYAVARARHEEFGYHRSGKQGFGPRLKYALFATFITHKTTTGKSTVAAGELSGAFGSGLVSRLWQPASTGSIATGFASGGITLGVDSGVHVLREFWPDIRHPHRHHVAPERRRQ